MRAASVCAMIANVNRNVRRRSKPFEVQDFMLSFGDDPYVGRPRQTWQQQKAIAQIYAAAFSAPQKKRTKKA